MEKQWLPSKFFNFSLLFLICCVDMLGCFVAVVGPSGEVLCHEDGHPLFQAPDGQHRCFIQVFSFLI